MTEGTPSRTPPSPPPEEPAPYAGWSTEITNIDAATTNEILLYAHPSKTADLARDAGDFFSGIGGPQAGERRSPTDADLGLQPPSGASNHSGGSSDLDAELRLHEQDAVNVEELRSLCTPLEIDNRCNVCAIISICLKQADGARDWLLDYTTLCYKCSHAPRTPMSTLIVTSEFIHILKTHFRSIDFSDVFRNKILTPFDFHMHFFINRCFSQQDGNPIANENTTLNHTMVVRSLLMGEDAVPYTKHRRFTLAKKPPKKPSAAGPAATAAAAADGTGGEPSSARDGSSSSPPPSSPLQANGFVCAADLTDLLFYVWSGTNIFFSTTLTDLAIVKHRRFGTVDEARATVIERCTGPIYLSPTPVFTIKNHTTTVCLLCELMACSYRANLLLRNIYAKIMGFCENNVKIFDRIQLVLAETLRDQDIPPGIQNKNRDVSRHVCPIPRTARGADNAAWTGGDDGGSGGAVKLDVPTYVILRQVGVTGIYKHFFCDPQCAANIRSTRPEILFARLPPHKARETKLSICYENNYINHVDRRFWLYAQTFKAFQLTKRNHKAKTQLADFLKDFAQVLESNNIELVEPAFIVDKYV